ncbi:hypothetical protein FOA43_004821 [Brettanomyces nanus]|uniref:Allantoate permease n=1 Tax=Eeniella nana TaxID=13502 RepID=A0A875RYQ4_EENNA|nr:uncharacterized protein FOA43_004821 [Brettanomyces nanus]QPG77407.1 hypothetical protein FOA43_004821 [Brettanomyces nanus]
MVQEKENFTETVESDEQLPGKEVDLQAYFSNGDVALQVIADQSHQKQFSKEEENAVLRKIDLHLIPFMFVSYFLQFLDKNALSNSSVFGLSTSLNLVGDQYSWAGSLFYFGYLIGQPVASRSLQYFSIAKYVGICLIFWSIVLVCTSATSNFAGLAVIRVFLGLFEATVSPAWLLLTGMWYRSNEMPMRNAYWYCANACGVIFGGLIAYGLGHIQSSINSWKWFYIIYGIITFYWGFAVYFALPDSIPSCKFLNSREKYIAVERLRANRTGVKNKTFKKEQAVEALKDPQIWILALNEFVGCLPAGGIQNFGNLIIKSFGFSSFQTVLMNMPSGVIQGGTLLLSGLIISRIPDSAIIVQSLCNIPCLIGTCIVKYLPNHPNSKRNGKLVAFWIQYANTMSDISLFVLMQRNISGFTKKIVANSIFFIAYCVGMIAAPQFFKSTQAPGYDEGFRMMIICWVILIVIPWFLYFYYKRENSARNKRDELDAREGRIDQIENEEFLDLTDQKQRGFRYTL